MLQNVSKASPVGKKSTATAVSSCKPEGRREKSGRYEEKNQSPVFSF
jgi:hypothetical protein